MIRASAPGKLMLAGEYTVADPGGRALSVAVNRRVTVHAKVEEGGWKVTSEGLGLRDAPPSAVPLIAVVLEAMNGLPPGGSIVIDSDLGVGPSKPGLGASAAILVAALGALKALAGAGRPTLEEAIELHRRAQGGRGSGFDIATALSGGVCLFDSSVSPATSRVVTWPEGLHAAVFFTGHGASTTALLDRFACWKEDDPEAMMSHLRPLHEEASEFIDAFLAGDVQRILTAAAQNQEELDGFDRAGELGIYAGGQMQLLGAIEDAGAIGRTSGAGGGDCAWGLSDDPATLKAATSVALSSGFVPVDVEWPAPGLVIEEVD